MATFTGDSPHRSDKANAFAKIRKKIEDNFDSIIEKVTERRDALLQQLAEWEGGGSEEVKSSKQEMEQFLVTLKSEEARKSLQKSIDELAEKISECENISSELSFVCETNELEWRISQLGVLSTAKKGDNGRNIARQYNSIVKPLLSFGTRGTGPREFIRPRGVLVDEDNNRVLICDKNNKIQIWSLNGQFLSEFAVGTLKWPWEIVRYATFLFVSDFETHLISKWCCNSLDIISKSNTTQGSKQGQLNKPAGLDVDCGEVFVVEFGNRRVSVFDTDLRFKRIMANKVINKAFCLRIRSHVIYIVEFTGVIKLFSKADQLVRTIDKSDIFSDFVFHFNFDSALNFLITDQSKNSLSILSPEGELMYCIYFNAWGVNSPFGIDVTRNGHFVISFEQGSVVIIC